MVEYVAVTNKSGKEIDYLAASDFMDPELVGNLHDRLAPCTEQEFFTAYEAAHDEKFGEEWLLSGPNPVW